MKVTKRNGICEELSFDKVLRRLRSLKNVEGLNELKYIDSDVISKEVIRNIYDGVKTSELDEVAARICIGLSTEHPEYSDLASRIIISNMHKNTLDLFSDSMEILYHNKDVKNTGTEMHVPLVSEELINIVRNNKKILDECVDYKRDYLFDYFGFKTLERSYLLKIFVDEDNEYKIIERPQHMWLRVSIGIHKNDIEKVLETYYLLSNFYFTHASPTLFNSGTPTPQLSSCFHEDTIITTLNKGPVKIKNVQLGDKVITHLGNIKKVLQVHKNQLNDRKFYELNVFKTKPIKVTGNHKFWVINFKDKGVNNKISEYRQYNQAQWKSVEDLESDDYICIPNKKECGQEKVIDLVSLQDTLKDLKYITDYDDKFITLYTQFSHNNLNNNQVVTCKRKHTTINRIWKINSDFAKFIGIFYRVGHIISKDNKTCGVGITIHNENKELIKFCKEKGAEIFGITPVLRKPFDQNNNNTTQVLYNSVYIGHVFKELFGKGFNNKKIWNDMYLWDKALIKSLLEGLIAKDCCEKTDGCISKNYSVTLQMSNVMFMRDLYYLLRNNNIDCSYNENGTREHIQTSIPIDNLNIDDDNNNKFYADNRIENFTDNNNSKYYSINHDNFKYLRYISKTEITLDLPEFVYTLGIEDDHSYNVEGLIAENCFLIQNTDSMSGIYKCISDCALISKHAGGIGIHTSNVRSKGSYIKGTNGKSDGIVKMLKVFNETARFANQGSKRNGSFAVYLEPFHADIFEFLELRKNSGDENLRARDLFYALWVNDLFMEAVEKNGDWYLMSEDMCPRLTDVYGEEFRKLYNSYVEKGLYVKKIKARDLWTRILISQIETGMPYMTYKDHINEKSNQKNIGVIKSSNLCVSPETKILTSQGYYEIKSLENQEVEVWNGDKFSKTTVLKTGENQELLKITFNNGSEIECTPYHKFYIVEGARPSEYPKIRKIEAKELKPDMRLIKSEFPVIKEGCDSLAFPYENGLFSADGTRFKMKPDNYDVQKDGRPVLFLYGEKKELLKYISYKSYKLEEYANRIRCSLNRNEIVEKFTVPLNCDLDTKLRWLEGYVDGDGCVVHSDKLTGIQAVSINKKFIDNVKYLLQTLGCDPKITDSREECAMILPNGKYEPKLFNCQKSYRILITSHDTALLVSLGFSPKRLKLSGIYPKNNTKRWTRVKNIEYTNRISDTYCFNEPEKNMGVFNGVLAGNCAEITLVSNENETAVCNICTFSLPKYVKVVKGVEATTGYFDHEKLFEVVKVATKNMNNVIDYNFYPVPETKTSNFNHRPIAMGIQGLANVFFKLKIPFESERARIINKEIMETIQYAGWTASMEIAKEKGETYSTYKGSPISNGIFQHNMWGIDENSLSGRWDWGKLRNDIKKYGVMNSMITALPPTASTSQILGNYESFEPQNSNMFMRSTLSGDFPVINSFLINDLIELGLWNEDMKKRIINNNGSVQKIDSIPQNIKDVYKTIWEVSQKTLIDMSVDRSYFVDQTQSLNIYMEKPTISKLSSCHFHSWKRGCKTGMYYLRSKSASQAQKFTVDKSIQEEQILQCSIDNKDACEACSG